MQARFYSPIYRRFLSEDPAGFSGGINLYGYVSANPVSLIDPFGLGPSSFMNDAYHWFDVLGITAFNNAFYWTLGELGRGAQMLDQAQMSVTGVPLDAMPMGRIETGGAAALVAIGAWGVRAEKAAAVVARAARAGVSNPGPNGFVLVGEGSLHSTVAVRQGSLVNRVFDSGFATNRNAAQPLGRYFGEGGTLPSSAGSAITTRGLNLPGIVNDAQMGAVYRANTHIPALRGPAAGGTGPELIIDRSYFRNLDLQGGYVPIAP